MNGSPPWSYELSNFVPFISVPVYWTCTVSPVFASRPVPTLVSSVSSFVGPGGSGVPSAGLNVLVGSSGDLEQAVEAAAANTPNATVRIRRVRMPAS